MLISRAGTVGQTIMYRVYTDIGMNVGENGREFKDIDCLMTKS